MKDLSQAIELIRFRNSGYKLLSLLLTFLLPTATQAEEWLPLHTRTLNEPTTPDIFALSGDLPSPSHLSLAQTIELEAEIPIDRPYGFGRELDDESPANYSGLKRDAGYFFGYQFFIVGLLYVMPEEISAWSEEQKEDYSVSKWWENVTHPRWDPDKWYINYILHPYWGMTYYTRGRERGLDETGAFWYSFTLSSIYEFGLEALFEPVSIQDLIFTPGVGSLLGWYIEDTRRSIKSQASYNFWDKTILVVTDPLGTLNTIVDDMIGTESELELRAYYRSTLPLPYHEQIWSGPHLDHTNPAIKDYLGLQLSIPWN
jgi:hypothetical protein